MDTGTTKVVPCYLDSKYGEFAILTAIANLGAVVKDSEAALKESNQVQTNFINQNQNVLLQKVCDTEKAAIENRGIILAEVKETKFDIVTALKECCCDMKTMNLELKQFITDRFCDLERRELQEEIQELRDAKADGVSAGLASAINALAAKIK